ncbi:MAG TPA: hypothetical protein VJS92_15570 [Candidatus Polarisedimenticolaceae bacterium]|nr:hypothetical protein [Candidatus Polarisedimenticolaceae bacterium]
MRRLSILLSAHGPSVSAIVATLVGLPSLGLPFLSDDWMHLLAAHEDVFLKNPFSYFRPLCSLSYWVDWQL